MELAPVSTRRAVVRRRVRWATGAAALVAPALLLLALVSVLPALLGLESRVDAAGTVLVERMVPTSDLAPGDLVTRALPGGGGETVERVVDLEPGYVVTRSAAEPGALPTRSMVVEHPTMPLVVASVPYVGRPLAVAAPGTELLWGAGLALAALLPVRLHRSRRRSLGRDGVRWVAGVVARTRRRWPRPPGAGQAEVAPARFGT